MENLDPPKRIERPVITSWDDFKYISETCGLGDSKALEFKHTEYIFVNPEDGAVWHGTVLVPKDEVALEQANACLTPVPDECIYPTLPDNDFQVLHPASLKDEGDVYFKGPNLLRYEARPGGDGRVSQALLDEVRVLEMLSKYPHPNIVEYLGCVVEHGRIRSVALKKYPMTLEQRCADDVVAARGVIDKAAALRGLTSALDWLNYLGIAHNDVNPRNVCVDEGDRCFLVDFGSCRRLGEELREMGTEGFNEGFVDCSSWVNDEYGLDKICDWLEIPQEMRMRDEDVGE